VLPSGLTAIPFELEPTGIVAVTVFVVVLITETELPPDPGYPFVT
jgi:hypothetical protein